MRVVYLKFLVTLFILIPTITCRTYYGYKQHDRERQQENERSRYWFGPSGADEGSFSLMQNESGYHRRGKAFQNVQQPWNNRGDQWYGQGGIINQPSQFGSGRLPWNGRPDLESNRRNKQQPWQNGQIQWNSQPGFINQQPWQMGSGQIWNNRPNLNWNNQFGQWGNQNQPNGQSWNDYGPSPPQNWNAGNWNSNNNNQALPVNPISVLPNNRFPSNPTTVSPTSTTASGAQSVSQCIRRCPVTSEYNPVCGTNNVTYDNPSRLECAKFCGVAVELGRSSRCTAPQPPPLPIRPRPTTKRPTNSPNVDGNSDIRQTTENTPQVTIPNDILASIFTNIPTMTTSSDEDDFSIDERIQDKFGQTTTSMPKRK